MQLNSQRSSYKTYLHFCILFKCGTPILAARATQVIMTMSVRESVQMLSLLKVLSSKLYSVHVQTSENIVSEESCTRTDIREHCK